MSVPAGGAAPCPSCGAPLGGRSGCQATFDELSAAGWASPVRGAVHNLLVDTYAMQHPEEYGRSAKSYAAHLTALCCAMESGSDPELYWAIPRWLDGNTAPAKPALLDSRGTATIADVRAADSDTAYAERVRAWARNVWEAYAAQQALARGWLRLASARQPLRSTDQ